MRKRFLNIAIALGMVVGLLAGVMGSASAVTPTAAYGGTNWIFYPWVPNGEKVDSTGPWYGSITIQNLEDSPIDLTFGPTAGSSGGTLTNVVQTAIVAAHAAYTFSASQIFGATSTVTGGGVAATAAWDPNALPSFCSMVPGGTLTVQRNAKVENLPNGSTKTADQDVLAGLPSGAVITGITGTGGTGTYTPGVDFTQSGNEITWITSNRPNNNSLYTVSYNVQSCDGYQPAIAGVEKQAAPDSAGFGVDTSNTDLAVDGYSAVSDADTAWGPSSAVCSSLGGNLGGLFGYSINDTSGPDCNNLGSYFLGLPIGAFFGGSKDFGFDGTSYLPIVQNDWSGWDTIINVTNVDASTPSYSQVTLTFYNQGQGVGNQAAAVKQFTLPAGGSMQIDTASVFGSTTPFLGSVWITSDFGVVANAVRIKNSTNMAVINTSVPSLLATTSPTTTATQDPNTGQNISFTWDANGEFTMYAPLVYKNYNGWNTGINIANTSEFMNQVTVQFFSNDGTSMGTCTTAIPAKGMQYCYIPASQDQGLGNGDFGTAVLTGNMPFAATVDEVKYSTGEAMSYAVTGTTIGHSGFYCTQPSSGQPGDVTPDQPGDFPLTYCGHGNTLSLPLFQNGHNVGGVEHGDTSGINIFNPGSKVAQGTVTFYALDGSLQTPSNIGTVPFSVASLSTALLYAPSFAQMTPGIQLTAVVTDTAGRIVAVSNNVNYDVTADGSTAFNLFNQYGQYRYVCSQQQCGLAALVQGVVGQFNIGQ